MQSPITPEIVMGYTTASEGFLCEISDNIYDIRFGPFRIRDMESNKILFDIEQEFNPMTEESRFIQYTFPSDMLLLRSLGTTINFSVGELPVPQFMMIEKHYFRNHLLQSYDFSINFMMPNSVNSHEFIYELPPLPTELVIDIISNPFEAKSDSFFFVENKLVMHVRAEYDYSG